MRRGSGTRRALCAVLLSFCCALPAGAQTLDRVRLQLMWFNQAQFAGVYMARDEGLYAREGLDVTAVEGGPGIVPADVIAKGGADVATAWLPSAIDARRRGEDVVNIAQIFRKPGMTVLCRRDAGIHGILDVADKTIGVWNVGDELNVRDWLKGFSIPLARVTLVQQKPDGADLAAGRVACATAMMYNEYWSILAAGLSPDKLIDARLGDNGYAFLEDGLYATRAELDDPARRAVPVRFLRATLAGWRLAAEHPDDALAATMAAAPRADPLHQRRMLETILGLIGDAAHAGELDRRAYEHSVEAIARENPNPQAIRAASAAGWTDMLWRAATARRD